MGIELGIVSLAYRIASDMALWITRRRDPAAVLRHRAAIKREIKAHLVWVHENVEYGEAIVRDVRRMDSYPEPDSRRRGASPWFKVWILGLYHRGLAVGLGIHAVSRDDHGEWRLRIAGDEQSMNAYLVGRIPFDTIVQIDWSGDDMYRSPHIYARFSHRHRQPYEELMLCTRDGGTNRSFYHDLVDYHVAESRQKRCLKSKGLTTG